MEPNRTRGENTPLPEQNGMASCPFGNDIKSFERDIRKPTYGTFGIWKEMLGCGEGALKGGETPWFRRYAMGADTLQANLAQARMSLQHVKNWQTWGKRKCRGWGQTIGRGEKKRRCVNKTITYNTLPKQPSGALLPNRPILESPQGRKKSPNYQPLPLFFLCKIMVCHTCKKTYLRITVPTGAPKFGPSNREPCLVIWGITNLSVSNRQKTRRMTNNQPPYLFSGRNLN